MGVTWALRRYLKMEYKNSPSQTRYCLPVKCPVAAPTVKAMSITCHSRGPGVLDLTLALLGPGVSAYGKLGKGCCITPSGFVKIKEISMLCQQEVSGQTGG